MTLGNIVDLGNGIAYDFVKPDLQNCIQLWVIVGLGNGIAYDFVKPDLQNIIRLWVHMTSLAQIRPNPPEIV